MVATSELRIRSLEGLIESLVDTRFTVECVYGDWKKGSLLRTSRVTIFVAHRGLGKYRPAHARRRAKGLCYFACGGAHVLGIPPTSAALAMLIRSALLESYAAGRCVWPSLRRR